MNSVTQFLRMAKWARRPPSMKRVILVGAVILLCLALFGIERLFGWPDWLSPAKVPRGRL